MQADAHDAGAADLDRFFRDVEALEDELREVEWLHRALHESNKAGRALQNASAVHALRAQMDADAVLALKKARLIRLRLESLDRANAAHRAIPGCGPCSSADRARTSVVAGLRKKLRDAVDGFAELRRVVADEYRETVARRFYTVTGEAADEATVEALAAWGEGERLLQRVIEEQGGEGQAMDVVTEIRERHDAAADLERSLAELQQVFTDMAVLVETQGQQLEDIESNIGRAHSYVRQGAEELDDAGQQQKSTQKWTCIAITVVLLVILIIVLAIVLTTLLNKKNPSLHSSI